MKRKTLLCFRTVFHRGEETLQSLLLGLQHAIEEEKDLLQRRLLESIQFELNACSKEVVQGKTAILSDQTVAKFDRMYRN